MLMRIVENRWAYRSIFVAQYGVAAIGTIFLPFMPEVSSRNF
jgi:SP family general alpha glucoside:H+ symporter-like MFS transporter